MKLPTTKTPIDRLIVLGRYSATVVGLSGNAELAPVAQALDGAAGKVRAAQRTYEDAVLAAVETRARVRWADYRADVGVRALLRAAETADGKRGGRIARGLFPDGVTPLVHAFGATEVAALRDLEGRLDAQAADWPEAANEKVKIAGLRTAYESALAARADARQKAADARVARDAIRENVLDAFAKLAGRVRAEYPRQADAQELFFEREHDTVDAPDEVDAAEAPATATA
jgi:hypothetical protein